MNQKNDFNDFEEQELNKRRKKQSPFKDNSVDEDRSAAVNDVELVDGNEIVDMELYKGRYIPKVKSRPHEKREYKEYVPKKAKIGPVLVILILFIVLSFYFFKTPIMRTIAHPSKIEDNFSSFVETQRQGAKVTSLNKKEIQFLCADENLVNKDAQKRIKTRHVLYDNEIMMLKYYRGAKDYLTAAYPDGGWKITKFMKSRNGITTLYGVYFKMNGKEMKCNFDKTEDGKMKIYDVNTEAVQATHGDYIVDFDDYSYGIKYLK